MLRFRFHDISLQRQGQFLYLTRDTTLSITMIVMRRNSRLFRLPRAGAQVRPANIRHFAKAIWPISAGTDNEDGFELDMDKRPSAFGEDDGPRLHEQCLTRWGRGEAASISCSRESFYHLLIDEDTGLPYIGQWPIWFSSFSEICLAGNKYHVYYRAGIWHRSIILSIDARRTTIRPCSGHRWWICDDRALISHDFVFTPSGHMIMVAYEAAPHKLCKSRRYCVGALSVFQWAAAGGLLGKCFISSPTH